MRRNAYPKNVRTSAPIDSRVIYSGDNLDQLLKLPDTWHSSSNVAL